MKSRGASLIHSLLMCACALTSTLAASAQQSEAPGPDVVYSDCTGISNDGLVGTIRAYTLDSFTCNIGTMDLRWGNAWNGTPYLAMNVYRLHSGRLEQLGMSWCKRACCAGAGNGCSIACNGVGGSFLGVGCLDVYSSGWNAIQSALAPRSGINAFTGASGPANGTSGNAIFKRMQVTDSDMEAANFPTALYFVEGVYVGTDEAPTGNALNNASYKRVNVGAGAHSLTPTGSIQLGTPAIRAWRDHGLGVNTVDPSVQIVNVDVPSEGRFVAGYKASDNGNGTWRYTYAVFNLNSDRSGASLSIPVAQSINVSNIGFRDVPYHSGEPYDNTDWIAVEGASAVSWNAPGTFAANPNSNALRWGTMYTFWFDADAPPGEAQATLGLFKPHSPQSVSFAATGPVQPCPADIAPGPGDGTVNITDLLFVISNWGGGAGNPADLNGDNIVNMADLLDLIAAWGPC